MPAVPLSTKIWKLLRTTNSVALKLALQQVWKEIGRHIRCVNLTVSIGYVEAGCDGLIHCARRKADTADPAEVTLELLLLTHTGHVLIILAPSLTIAVVDGHVGGVYGLFLVILAPGCHRELI